MSSTHRLAQRASTAAFVLAATLGFGTGSVLPAQSAVLAAAPTPTTTTVELQSATVSHGETSKVVVTVDSTTNGGPKPTGKAELTVGGTVLIADVANSGRAEFDLPLLGASATPYSVTARFLPTDELSFTGSSALPASLTVTKDATTSAVAARHRVGTRRIIAKSFVTSTHGQVPTGKVRFVLRRNGAKIDAIVASLNGNSDPTRNLARAKFLDVARTGTYEVVAKYRGSADFLASRGSSRIPR